MDLLILVVAGLALAIGILNLRYSTALGARLQQGYAPAPPPRAGDHLDLAMVDIPVDRRTIVVAGEATCLACKTVAQAAIRTAADLDLDVVFIWADGGPARLAGSEDCGWFVSQRQLLTNVGVTAFPFVILVEPGGAVARSGPIAAARQVEALVASTWPSTPSNDTSEVRS